MIRKAVIISCLVFLVLALLPSYYAFCEEAAPPAEAEEPASDWVEVKSSYATIHIDKDVSVRGVSKRIDVGFAKYDPVERKLFLDKGISDEDELANKIDIIVRKAKKILDMHPQNFHVNIRVYKNEKELWDAYETIFKERVEHRAFYIHKFKTVYIPLENVHESVLAHEIGHSIIDNYFAILPPQKIRELLACYVDVHLKD